MITEFESGKFYVFKSKKPGVGFSHSKGTMDFILDGLPHKCNTAKGRYASFFDSIYPNCRWAWGLEDLANFELVEEGQLFFDF